ncbi:MAG: response regulator [Nitrospinae bacterium]|nr:response regulator [Nitrospinota bacterium]
MLTAQDGEEALAACLADPPDLILSDIMMPKLDGFGLLRKLRAEERTATLPIIMLSARAGEEARIGGIAKGADDYLAKPFHARELVSRARREVECELRQAKDAAAEMKKISLSNNVPPETVAQADPELLGEALHNIVVNAIKFTHEGGCVRVFTPEDNVIAVEDNGIGVNPGMINKLFTADGAISSPGTAGESGTGLGLLLCSDVIKAHGGVISVKSEPGKGSVFSIHLPQPTRKTG